jgi:hypothetical protein
MLIAKRRQLNDDRTCKTYRRLTARGAACRAAVVILSAIMAFTWQSTIGNRLSDSSATNFKNSIIVPDFRDYTTHFCSGGAIPEVWGAPYGAFVPTNWKDRSCVFRNLVWDGNSSFIYYYDTQRPAVWEYELGSGSAIVNADGASMLKTMLHGVNVNFRVGPIPRDVQHAQLDANAQSGFILAIPAEIVDKRNIGHVLGDFVWPLFVRLVHMNFLSLSNTILYHLPPGDTNDKMVGRQFLQGLTVNPIKRLVDYRWPTRYHLLHAGRSIPYSTRSWWSNVERSVFVSGMIASLLRDAALQVTGVSLLPNKLPKIALRERKGLNRHAILNTEGLLQHLRQRYTRAEIVLFAAEDFNADLSAELRFMTSIDVYITSEGGGCFPLVYMRNGAAIIMANPCWPGNARDPKNPGNGLSTYNSTGETVQCGRMDHFVWDSVPYLHKLYYSPFNTSPHTAGLRLVGDLNDVENTATPLVEYSYPVDLAHMDVLVDTALRCAGFSDHAIGTGIFPKISPGFVASAV